MLFRSVPSHDNQAELEEANRLKTEKFKQDFADLSSYNIKGDYNTSYYAKDGALVPIAPGIFQAKGNTHANGGIQFGNIEIENNELVKPKVNGTIEIDSAHLGTANANKNLAEDKLAITNQIQSINDNLSTENKKLN